MADIAIVPEHVQAAGDFVLQTARALAAGIRTADSEVAGLLTTWQGPAARSYAEGWQETRTGALAVFEALEQLAALLGVSAEQLAAVDRESAALQTPQTSSLNL